MQRLKAKAESGQADQEKVDFMAKQFYNTVVPTMTSAQKFLAEERKGHVVNELQRQLQWKSQRIEREKQLEEIEHARVLEQLLEKQNKQAEDDRRKAEERRRVQEDIRQQLAEREFRKLIEIESREQEAELLLAQARRSAEAVAALEEQKKLQAKQRARETAEANHRFAARDERRRQKELEEERAIMLYQIEKAQREAEADRALKEEAKEKERLTAELRAQQKRAMDGKAADDEAKAKRHVEAKILAERARAEEIAARKEASKQETLEQLSRQLELKDRRRADDKAFEEAQAALLRRDAAEAIARESERVRAKQNAAIEYKSALERQKDDRLRLKQLESKRPLEERRQQALVEQAEKAAIERFRGEVLGRMQEAALPETFTRTVKQSTIKR